MEHYEADVRPGDNYEKEKGRRTKERENDDSRQSRKRMEKSYSQMMERYAAQQKGLANKPNWVKLKTKGGVEPHELTVTHINQTKDLVKAGVAGAMHAENQSSTEWLNSHSIENMKLTLKDLVDRGQIARPKTEKGSDKVQQHLQFDAKDINEFEYKLNLAIESYTKRIKWLLQGSRKIFGLIKGTRIALLVDSSDAHCSFGRLIPFQEAMLHLIDEQLSHKKAIYAVNIGSDSYPVWKSVMDVNCRIITELNAWIEQLKPQGGCNLLKALKQVHKMKDIDAIVVILGSVPDQKADVLCDYMQQLGVGKDIPIQTISYDCNNQHTTVAMRRLADESNARYHCYSSACEEQIYTGTDINVLLKEVQTAQDVINKIKEMRQGLLGTALVSVMNEISNEVAKLPQTRFLPRPPGHDLPLRIEMAKFQPNSSSEWLSKHGLKAKGLDLYQVLAPNAFSYREEFIPVIRKTVQSQVNEKAMAQFQWHDGSIRNVHVDMTQLFEYQKQLGAMVKLYEKRVDWLSSTSRKIFGTVAENNVVILVDLSLSNMNYLVHIQHSLRLLMEQQIANKEYFNIIGFGEEVKMWRPTMSKPTPENLQKAWKWVLDLQCGGSKNFMAALRTAVENDDEQTHNVDVQGIYLFTSGIPDQPPDVCVSYVEEAAAGRDLKLHVLLFNVDDYDDQGAIPSKYANITKTAEILRSLAHCSGGRFHWFRETGIIESDDIAEISLEIEKALNFSKKCAMLVDSVKKKYNLDYKQDQLKMLTSSKPLPALPQGTALKSLPLPKHTALSQARMQLNDNRETEEPIPKTLAWRPSSEESVKRPPAKDPMQRVKSGKNKVQQSFFFTGDKKTDVGSVITKYPNTKPPRKGIKLTTVTEKEDQLETKDWMRMYSLSRLKLNLNKLVSGLECKHVSKHVKALNKNAEALYCTVFPTINVQGTLKHLQLLPHELQEYEEQVETVLRRYLKRLQWLLSGSRRLFGTVVEKKCIFLIDTSGSMDPYMEELKKELASLIWDQLYKHKVKFNLIQFSKKCESWKNGLAEPIQSNCHDAVKWVSRLTSNGNTCTLDALQMAFDDPEVEAIYLFTDGKPDTSTALVLKEVANMNTDRQVVVNTISFNCMDSTANGFLKMVAKETGGRYHHCHGEFDAHLFAHKLLTEGFQDPEHPALPDFEGDDLKRLGAEILQARRFLAQSRSYRAMYDDLKKENEERMNRPHSCIDSGLTIGHGSKLRPKSSK